MASKKNLSSIRLEYINIVSNQVEDIMISHQVYLDVTRQAIPYIIRPSPKTSSLVNAYVVT
jgi:hypothetical protein